MDDFEIDAFILDVELYNARRAYPRSEVKEANLKTQITQLRKKSQTYRPLGKGRGARRPIPKYKTENGGKPLTPVRVIHTGKVYPSIKACAKAIGGNAEGVRAVINGKRNEHRGYFLERVEQNNV